MIYNLLAKSGIEYKPADFKAEVHYLGQIEGISNIIESELVFVEAFFEKGEQWKFLSQQNPIQTQTCYPDINNYATFAHPFDLHLTTENLYGWPRMIVRVWKHCETNKVNLISYGIITLPNSIGYHQLEINTWSLKGNLEQETLSHFTNSKPLTNTSDPVNSYLDQRVGFISKPGPIVHITVEVIFKNFTFHSLSGI